MGWVSGGRVRERDPTVQADVQRPTHNLRSHELGAFTPMRTPPRTRHPHTQGAICPPAQRQYIVVVRGRSDQRPTVPTPTKTTLHAPPRATSLPQTPGTAMLALASLAASSSSKPSTWVGWVSGMGDKGAGGKGASSARVILGIPKAQFTHPRQHLLRNVIGYLVCWVVTYLPTRGMPSSDLGPPSPRLRWSKQGIRMLVPPPLLLASTPPNQLGATLDVDGAIVQKRGFAGEIDTGAVPETVCRILRPV